LRDVVAQLHIDADNRDLTAVDAHREDRVAAGEAIVLLAIVGERMDCVLRVAAAATA